MVTVECVVDPQSLRTSRAGLFTGTLYLRLGDSYFPDERWTDFPVRVLVDWINKLKDVRSAARKSARLMFMDGPYQVLVRRTAAERCLLVAQERRVGRVIDLNEWRCQIGDLDCALRSAGGILLETLHPIAPQDGDVRRLSELVDRELG